MLSDGTRSFDYTSYDLVKRIGRGRDSISFTYGADRARWKREDVKNQKKTTTTYIGNVERVQGDDGFIEWRRTVGDVVFTYRTSSTNQLVTNGSNVAYLYKDHLGSVDVITNAVGQLNVTNSMGFDPWGARRDGDTWADMTEDQRIAALYINGAMVFKQPITQQGFTGHEMLDDMGIIHMNGRIYDPHIGRFLQADPHVDGARDTQGFNRYSYLQNNPLNATDPTGFFKLRQWVGLIVAVVATVVCENAACGQYAYVWIGGASGAASAAANGQNILLGAFTGALTGAVGAGTSWSGFFTRGLVGGVTSVMMGGKFGNGFITAGLSSLVPGTDTFLGDVAVNAIAGGTISELTGGKFSNGAASAAFAYVLSYGAQKMGAGGTVEPAETNNSNPGEPGISADSPVHRETIGKFKFKYYQSHSARSVGENMVIEYTGDETGGKWIQSVTSSTTNNGETFIDTDYFGDIPKSQIPASRPFYNDQTNYFKGKAAMYDTPATETWRKSFVAETSYVVPKAGGGYREVATFKWGYTTDMTLKVRTITLMAPQKLTTPSPFQSNLIKSAQ